MLACIPPLPLSGRCSRCCQAWTLARPGTRRRCCGSASTIALCRCTASQSWQGWCRRGALLIRTAGKEGAVAAPAMWLREGIHDRAPPCFGAARLSRQAAARGWAVARCVARLCGPHGSAEVEGRLMGAGLPACLTTRPDTLRQLASACLTPTSSSLQGPLVVLAMELMEGGSLLQAVQNPVTRAMLRWEAGYAGQGRGQAASSWRRLPGQAQAGAGWHEAALVDTHT